MKTYNFIEAVKKMKQNIPMQVEIYGEINTLSLIEDDIWSNEKNDNILAYIDLAELVTHTFTEKTTPEINELVLIRDNVFDNSFILGQVKLVLTNGTIDVDIKTKKTVTVNLHDITRINDLIGKHLEVKD